MIRLKDDSINLSGLTTQTLFAIVVAEGVYGEHGAELVITSANDGMHMTGSLHNSGNAVDFRIRNLKEADKSIVAKKIRERLGNSYDVVLETHHLHVEYQP